MGILNPTYVLRQCKDFQAYTRAHDPFADATSWSLNTTTDAASRVSIYACTNPALVNAEDHASPGRVRIASAARRGRAQRHWYDINLFYSALNIQAGAVVDRAIQIALRVWGREEERARQPHDHDQRSPAASHQREDLLRANDAEHPSATLASIRPSSMRHLP